MKLNFYISLLFLLSLSSCVVTENSDKGTIEKKLDIPAIIKIIEWLRPVE